MNRRLLLALATFCGLLTLARAEPLVLAYSRFHLDAPSADGGRILYNELGCSNCHGKNTELPMRQGPEIRGVVGRIQADWIRRFLTSPETAHPGSTMPALVGSNPDDIEAVVHYLGSLKPKNTTKPKIPTHVNAGRGSELFHTVGCVACHQARETFVPEEGIPKPSERSYASNAFPQLAEKYSLASLTAFLLDPLLTRPDGRMPRIALEETEAADIAGYLLGFGGSDGKTAPGIQPLVVDSILAKRGETLVEAARCAACHELSKEKTMEKIPVKDTQGGCLSEQAVHRGPRYALDKNQRAAIALHLKGSTEPLSSSHKTALTLQALNCYACHERDGLGGPDAARKVYFTGDHNLGDTGRYPPPLTGVGRKLRQDWLAKVLEGDNRVRPYLKTRMPVYGAATAELAPLFEVADKRVGKPLPGGDDTAGRKLLGTQGGVGCITCHRWGGRAALGIQALDLSNLGQRLQPEWFFEYLLDPAAYRPGTLMPSFWSGGQSTNSGILAGDTAKQIASIYSFAASANGEPEGFLELDGGQFELVPKERPIVQRTFLKEVGTHAILVGFPTGVHLAFDGKNGRPVLLWKGRFFDAYTTWFSRFAPFEKPLSDAIVKWPEEPSHEPTLEFIGYRLDKKGVPSFLYSASGARVEERFEGVENGITRVISWAQGAPEPAVTHPAEVVVQEVLPRRAQQRQFTYFWK